MALTSDVAPAGSAHPRLVVLVGVLTVTTLAVLLGWLGYRGYESHQAADRRGVFLEAGRRAAVNLTTVDYADAEADVKRILDSATGTFYDSFAQRAPAFIEVVKQARSKSAGTVTEAGVESDDGDHARVLVAVTVRTSNADLPEQAPQGWRMRITVQKTGQGVKVSNVESVA